MNGEDTPLLVEKDDVDGEAHAERMYGTASREDVHLPLGKPVPSEQSPHPFEHACEDSPFHADNLCKLLQPQELLQTYSRCPIFSRLVSMYLASNSPGWKAMGTRSTMRRP